MQRIPLSHMTESMVVALHGAVEVCSDAGVPLGVFMPTVSQRLPGEPDFDWNALQEELATAPSDLPTLDEVWKKLGA